jgi:hypothetical protein
MIRKGTRFLRTLRGMQRINMALTRGMITSSSRVIQPDDPATWEFSGFSQNGEDGIIDVLRSQLLSPSRYFIEVGSADGLENNTCWLSLVHRYSGLWIDAETSNVERSIELFESLNHGLRMQQLLLTASNVSDGLSRALHRNPDVLSLDIDSYDYFVASAILQEGFRPRIFVVEYNSAFGPVESLTVSAGAIKPVRRSVADRLYYGCSITGWRRLFDSHGYTFVTVERNGVNAFFADPGEFKDGFPGNVRGTGFAENHAQLVDCGRGWPEQWQMIAERQFTRVG